MFKRLMPLALLAMVLSSGTSAQAVHFYRNTTNGCSERTGELTDPGAPTANVTASVRMLHNLFLDNESGTNETRIKAGEAVRWTWNSAHCHSAESGAFNSGYHWPKDPPEDSPKGAEGFFDYPLFDETPTLSYVHIFNTPGTYSYICVHHQRIGMVGTVVVE